MDIRHNPVNLLPVEIREDISEKEINVNCIREIRIRSGKKISVIYDEGEKELDFAGNPRMINIVLENATGHSMYAYDDAIRQGFITIDGGHRIGVTGQVVMENGMIKTIKNISSINIRVARQVYGCSDSIIKRIINENRLLNVLVISPPGYGKTTILRDIVRQISGKKIDNHRINVSVVDERGELAAMYKGSPSNDLGSCTDILEGGSKKEGMMMLIRTMTPDILCIDEIGLAEDVESLRYVTNCGCNIFASVHGVSLEEVKKRPVVGAVFEDGIFDLYVFLKEKAGKRIIIYDKNLCQIEELWGEE